MLGMGGVLAEALSAASWRLCPVNRREASDMIGEIKGLSKILTGYRGRPAADVTALVDTLVNVSKFASLGKHQIISLDINPLAILPNGRGAVAVDALVIPDSRHTAEREMVDQFHAAAEDHTELQVVHLP